MGRGERLKRIPFALQHTPPPCPSTGSGGGRELRDGSPPALSAFCGHLHPVHQGFEHFRGDAGSPEPSNLSGGAWWLSTGSGAPLFQLLPAPSHPMQGQQKTWSAGLTWALCSRQFTGLMLGGSLLLRRPGLLSAAMESKVVRKGGGGVGCCQPGPPWASGLGSGGRGEGRGAAAAGIPGSLNYPARSCSSDTQCPAKPQAFY